MFEVNFEISFEWILSTNKCWITNKNGNREASSSLVNAFVLVSDDGWNKVTQWWMLANRPANKGTRGNH
jgi:hypothetical protein